MVDEPSVVEINIPEAEEKTDTPVVAEKPTRPRTPRKKKPVPKKKEESSLTAESINPLLTGLFSVISMKAGSHWAIDNEEAQQITVPLCNILKKLDLLEKVSNVSDGAMLVIALATITIPRVMISQQMMKESKKSKVVNNNGRIEENQNNKEDRTRHIDRSPENEPTSSKSIKADVIDTII